MTETDSAPVAGMSGMRVPAGELPWFLRKQLGLRAKRYFLYDAVVPIRFGERAYMLTDPADLKHVLVTNSANYQKSPHLTSSRGRQRQGNGLLTSVGQQHTRQRRLLQPLFQRNSTDHFSAAVLDRTQCMLARWADQMELDIAREMSCLALSILMGAVFGVSFHDDDNELAQAIYARRRYSEYVYHSHLPFREFLPTRTVRENRRAIQTIDRIVKREIQCRRNGDSAGNDMLSLFMSATYPDGSQMSDQLVRDEVLTLTSAGHETIGDALAWTCYLIAQHPSVESRLLTEFEQVLGGRPLVAKRAAELDYTDMVLSESMRIYPPTWIYTRVPIARDVLPGGNVLQPGCTVYACPYVMHRHPDYFPDPERFDPDRFTVSARKSRRRCVYFPFGDGPHTCIGESLARLEGSLVLAQIVRRYHFELLPHQRIVPTPGITLHPSEGIRVRLIRRSNTTT